jgi:hypothetical protein
VRERSGGKNVFQELKLEYFISWPLIFYYFEITNLLIFLRPEMESFGRVFDVVRMDLTPMTLPQSFAMVP